MFNFPMAGCGGWVIINPLCRQTVLHVPGLEDERGALHPCQEKQDLGNATAFTAPGAASCPETASGIGSSPSTWNKGLGEGPDLGLVVISAPFSPFLPAEHFYMFDPFILALPFFVP